MVLLDELVCFHLFISLCDLFCVFMVSVYVCVFVYVQLHACHSEHGTI